MSFWIWKRPILKAQQLKRLSEHKYSCASASLLDPNYKNGGTGYFSFKERGLRLRPRPDLRYHSLLLYFTPEIKVGQRHRHTFSFHFT
uniref:Uncharacterized protein n=1 Tax=Megaselia scalaris TaxID=36166 RepID=T1GEU0_MEGSC